MTAPSDYIKQRMAAVVAAVVAAIVAVIIASSALFAESESSCRGVAVGCDRARATSRQFGRRAFRWRMVLWFSVLAGGGPRYAGGGCPGYGGGASDRILDESSRPTKFTSACMRLFSQRRSQALNRHIRHAIWSKRAVEYFVWIVLQRRQSGVDVGRGWGWPRACKSELSREQLWMPFLRKILPFYPQALERNHTRGQYL